jgi:hypothetical protein
MGFSVDDFWISFVYESVQPTMVDPVGLIFEELFKNEI